MAEEGARAVRSLESLLNMPFQQPMSDPKAPGKCSRSSCCGSYRRIKARGGSRVISQPSRLVIVVVFHVRFLPMMQAGSKPQKLERKCGTSTDSALRGSCSGVFLMVLLVQGRSQLDSCPGNGALKAGDQPPGKRSKASGGF